MPFEITKVPVVVVTVIETLLMMLWCRFCAYTMHMARRDTDKDGNAVVPKLRTLVQQCAAKIAGDEETFSNDLDLMGTFRDQVQINRCVIFASECRVLS